MFLCITYAVLARRQTRFWENSYDLWARAVAVDPHCVLGRTNLGMLERQAGNIQTAIDHYEAALEVEPDSPILLNNYANALRYDPQRKGEAIGIMRRAVSLRPKQPDLHYTLANMLAEDGATREAIAEFHKCIKLKSEQPHPKYYRALGQVYHRTRKLDAAEEAYEKSLELELRLNPKGPGVIHAYDRLGFIKLDRREPDKAITYFRKILDLDPDNKGARRGLLLAQRLTQ
jgi:tetratricopeptide (TPR) repeat protein